MPVREVYQRNRDGWAAAEVARRRSKWPRVPDEELKRLRRPENRLEALAYGPEKKQLVCLNCGGIYESNFSRHPSACPQKPAKDFDSDGYREQWGYAKSNPLASVEWQQTASTTKRGSKKFRTAQERLRPSTVATFAARRASVSEAKKKGEPIRRGFLRAEIVNRRTGRRLPSRPQRQKVPDSAIAKILALDLPIAEGAKRAVFIDASGKHRHLSQTAFYRRAQRLGWQASQVKARRALITKYVLELRTWLRSQKSLPTIEQVIQRHVNGLQAGLELFREFQPFLPSFEAELTRHPVNIRDIAERRNSSAVITLAARVFQRARDRRAVGSHANNNAAAEQRVASERELEKGKRCFQIITEMRLIKQMCVDSGRTISEVQSAHPEYEVWKLRDALSDEDRETLNHPRQWGPVVGYARLVLAKDYGRNEGTVKNWVKSFRRWQRFQAPTVTTQ